MKYIRFLVFALFFAPTALLAATNEFMVAAQLLSAAKNADIQQVQVLVNSGANVNYTDSTGLSLVCTALMNNDVRAAQILQMYGADASQCDKQIKNYKTRNEPKGSGGLFGGLSSAQSIALAAAGAAVVVGGLFLLTDIFDPGNGNSGGAGGGDRPNGGNNGGGSGGATGTEVIPYGPAFFTADGKIAYSTAAYNANLSQWNPAAGGVRQWDFNYFRPDVQKENNYIVDGIKVLMQNYLLTMHGYSPFANGYMGQETLRDNAHNPVVLNNGAGGGKPIGVALISANGINPAGSAARAGGITWSDSASANSNTYTVDKYMNFASPTVVNGVLTLGAEQGGFDMSNSGTALNPFASAVESALGKIIAGWEAGGRGYGDLFGFVPNGQLAVYRTGGGTGWKNISDPTTGAVLGTVTKVAGSTTNNAIEIGDTITVGGKTYKISAAVSDTSVTNPTINVNGTVYKLPSNSTMLRGVCESANAADCENVSDIAIYRGIDNFYYVNTTGGNRPDAVYVINNNNIYAQKEYVETMDIKNFEAMYNARSSGGAVIANAALNPASRSVSYLTTGDLPALFNLAAGTDKKIIFGNQIDHYYDKDSTDATTQGGYANSMFNNYSAGLPIIVNPAGEFEFGQGDGKSLSVLDATFENYAPALYDGNLQHMFMTIIAVSHAKGTAAADSIDGYANGTGSAYGPLYLSMWTDDRGTTDTSDDVIYASRKCGIAGLGINGIDPWCFSAAGATSEMATAAAAGAVAAIKGAFSYMNNQQIFSLIALTADGYLLGTDDNGVAFNKDTLTAYLRAMYSLPPQYNAANLTPDEYLRAFAEVYGYGMINLERATTPNKKLYYYDGTKIVSAAGNAYWRAASNTQFRASSAFSPRTAKISAPFFDILTSVDGKMSMPRIWKNEFTVGADDARGLYMGDVLGELKTRRDAPHRTQIGNIGFSMAISEKPYNDNLAGLDALRLDYDFGNWNMAASYQRYFTDGASRFDGTGNPILGLSSNAIVSDAVYKSGNWSFGARAFSGSITDDELLENDPTVSAQYLPARLGLMQGAQSHISWSNGKFGFSTAIGTAHETDTLLGAVTSGLLNLGNGDTTYIDTELKYTPRKDLSFMLRSTFARTTSDPHGDFVLGMTDIDSDAIAFGADIGNFSFAVSRPLAVTRGVMKYAYAEYDIVEQGNGIYDLVVRNAGVRELELSPECRELRISGEYRHNFGAFTDGAVGFIYRVNPNNTNEFGNESIFMLKMTHRIGV